MPMSQVETVVALRLALTEARERGESIAIVPTMGALHAGHAALMQAARKRADLVVASIFVNPLQFGPSEDLGRYPRPLERDAAVAESHGVDVLFTPSVEEMYGDGSLVRVTAGAMGEVLEGEQRPGHFDGVLTVVAKLFNIVQPDIAVFGQKDIQQFILIDRMVRELDFPVKLVRVPTVREEDGLALSSRNSYLSRDERSAAAAIPRALRAVTDAWRDGERVSEVLEKAGRDALTDESGGAVDYLSVRDPVRFEAVPEAAAGSIVAIAVRFGSTRLLDNVILGEEPT